MSQSALLRCSRCQRALAKPFFKDKGLVLGRDCARAMNLRPPEKQPEPVDTRTIDLFSMDNPMYASSYRGGGTAECTQQQGVLGEV